MSAKKGRIDREKELVTRRISGETIIVPLRSGVGDLSSIYTVNEAGSVIWDLVEKGAQFEEILQALCSEFDVTEEDAEKDLTRFLESLSSAGLVEFSPAGTD